MNFFAYGCSFTYGAELADQHFCKKTREETERIKSSMSQPEFRNKYITGREDEYENLMHERSYASRIAKIIGAKKYINRAVSGGSNMHMFYNILEDIKTGKITTNDVIFVGLTSPQRYVWYDKTASQFRSTTVSGGPWPSEKFRKQYATNVSDQDYVLQIVQTFYAIKEITKDFKFFYQTTWWPYTHTYKKHEVNNNSLYSCLTDIDNNALIPNIGLFYELPEPANYTKYSHTFGHPYQEYHVSYGNKLGHALLSELSKLNNGTKL